MSADPEVIRVNDDLVYSFESQAAQHPRSGPPGISHRAVALDNFPGCRIDVLLYRNRKGRVVGILYHYAHDMPPLEKAGNVNIYVDPRRQQRGIGTALAKEAMSRWDIDPDQQRYSSSGLALRRALERDA